MPTPEQIQEWSEVLDGIELEVPTNAETFLRDWTSFSHPVAYACDDGEEYVVKGQHAGRAIANDRIVAKLGEMIGAPVGKPRLVIVPPELQAIEPRINNVTPGLSHGTLLISNCTDRLWVAHADLPENRARFALIAVLYGWCHSGDNQLIYRNDPPNLVYSVDHGHFFPGGPNWTTGSLAGGLPAELENSIVGQCALSDDERAKAVEQLDGVSDNQIIAAVGSCPYEWNVTRDEQIALIEFLLDRRNDLIESFLP